VASDGEYRIGDRLRSRVNPEIVWTVGGMVEGGLTILSPGGQAHDVDLPVIRARFENLRIDAESTAAPEWASDGEIEAFDASPAGEALREAEYGAAMQDDQPRTVEGKRDEPDVSDKPDVCEAIQAPRVRSIECCVSRKINHNYNSTEYRAGVTLDVPDGCDVAQVAAETYEMLRRIIRDEFSNRNGNGKDGK